MTILKKTDFELNDPGTTVASSSSVPGLDGTPTGGSAATVTADSGNGWSIRNKRALVLERTGSGITTVDQVISSTTSIRLRFYMTWLTVPSQQGAYISLRSGATARAQLFFNNSPYTVQLRNVNVAVGSASTGIVLGRRYRYEWKVNGPGAVQSLVMYEPDEVTKFYDSGDVTFTSATIIAHTIGSPASATTFKFAIDSILHSSRVTEEIGPESNMSFGFDMAAAA